MATNRPEASLAPNGIRRLEPDAPRNAAGERAIHCEICGAPVVDRHCKLQCWNCGAMRDCSDP